MRFVLDFAVFFAILAASTLPRLRIARQSRRRHNTGVWLASAGAVALAAAGLGVSSRSLVDSCLQEVNDGCVDAGGAGLQFVLVAGFILVALSSAYLLTRD